MPHTTSIPKTDFVNEVSLDELLGFLCQHYKKKPFWRRTLSTPKDDFSTPYNTGDENDFDVRVSKPKYWAAKFRFRRPMMPVVPRNFHIGPRKSSSPMSLLGREITFRGPFPYGDESVRHLNYGLGHEN